MKHDLFLRKVVLHNTELKYLSLQAGSVIVRLKRKHNRGWCREKKKKVNDPQKICENIAMSSLPQSQLA